MTQDQCQNYCDLVRETPQVTLSYPLMEHICLAIYSITNLYPCNSFLFKQVEEKYKVVIDNEEQTFADPIPNVCLRLFSYKQAHEHIILGNTTYCLPHKQMLTELLHIFVKS